MDGHHASRWWFLGTVIALPVIAYAFSGEGLFMFKVLGLQLPSMEVDTQRWIWLVAGLVVAFLLSLVAVRNWHAPPDLWLVAAAGAVLLALRLVAALPFLLAASSVRAPAETMATVISHTPFEVWPFYIAAPAGYVVAVAAGCRVGARLRSDANSGGAQLRERAQPAD